MYLGRVRSRPFVLALVLLSIIASIAYGLWTRRDYTAKNMRIVTELPVIEGATISRMSIHSGCGQDTCMPWYRYSYTMSLSYRVDTQSVTQQELIETFIVALDGWRSQVSERCRSAMPSICDLQPFVAFARGGARVGLDFLGWQGGQFTVSIDARGA
jgi:hypothetical protein